MLAAFAARISNDDPLSALEVGDRPEPTVPDGWAVVSVRAAALNHHDLWTLRGVGIDPDRLPIVLGCDASGVTEDGTEVVVHAVIATADGDETLAGDFSILSERYDGTFAEQVAVPARNLVKKPPDLSFEEAACLPTAYLTAYRMLFTRGDARPGRRVLVQGAGGGVSTAAIILGRAAGLTVYATSRDEAKRQRAVELGAHVAIEPGGRLPERVDIVIETVGTATWDHSMKSVAPGGTIVVAGATSGSNPQTDLRRVFYRQIRVVGSTMGTKSELESLVELMRTSRAHPLIDEVMPLSQARTALTKLAAGDVFGKIVLTVEN